MTRASLAKTCTFLLAGLFSVSFSSVFAEAPKVIQGTTTIDVNQAFDLYQQGAVFIDVRDKRDWESGHIQGALHLDFTAEEFIALYSNDAIDRATPIVFYCDSPLHNAGAMASYFAAEWGYSSVYYFRDGYYSWLAMDAPMIMGHKETLLSDAQPKLKSQAELVTDASIAN